MNTPDRYAMFCVFMEYPDDDIVDGLKDLFGLTDERARDYIAKAKRTHQEREITDAHDDMLDERARHGEHHA